jgi:transcriptional regulator cpsY
MTLQQLRYVITIAKYNSMNKAAKELFVSQPNMSETVRSLEEELNIKIFNRSNKGIVMTPEGEEFLSYARQVVDQYSLLEHRYIHKQVKQKFSVSMQHYTFAVKAFVDMAKDYDTQDYEFAVRETKTYEVIEDVSIGRSEIGVIFMNDFNKDVLTKILSENKLIFTKLFDCKIYAYMWNKHPLAKKKKVSMEDLQAYPCLVFDQGKNSSFYLSEEVLSTYDYHRKIMANDRATLLNLMVGLCGFTLCSGIICEDFNGDDYVAVPVNVKEIMSIGYICRKGSVISELGKKYIKELSGFKKYLM